MGAATSESYLEVYVKWAAARAFVVDDFVCGDFSLPSPEELAEAEAGDNDGCLSDYEPYVSLYIYGEHGLKREYFVSRQQIETGTPVAGGIQITYDDGRPLVIIPLFFPETLEA